MEQKTEKLTPADTEAAVTARRKTPMKGRKAIEKTATTLGRLIVEYVAVADLKPNSYNPNRQSEHDFELLLRSMEEDGFTQPIVVGNDNVIVDGEHRWRAGKALGYTEIPIVRVKMDAAQARIATIRHNRARGSHDVELEAEVLRDLQKLGALDWAADSLMLADDELNRLLEDVSAPEALAAQNFSDAWIPEKGKPEDAVLQGDVGSTNVSDRGGTQTVAQTVASIDAQRAAERAMEMAKTDQERAQIKKDMRVYRLSVIFSGEEGAIVQAALGDKPAQRLLEICKSLVSDPPAAA